MSDGALLIGNLSASLASAVFLQQHFDLAQDPAGKYVPGSRRFAGDCYEHA